jgi:hypothetical protein
MDTDDQRTRADAVLDTLRRPPERAAVFGGFGPLVVGAVLLLLLILLLPSVAPERVVERPRDAGVSTTTVSVP